MNIEQLTDEIKYYIKNDFIKQAIFVNGEWGTGKTHFFKNTLKDQLDIKNYLILSLYGLDSLEEIDKFLFLNLYPPAKLGEKIKSGIGKETSYFLKKITGSLFSKFSIDFTDLDYKDFINPKDVLLVLDDFERASISAIETLGYINNLTENYNMKVIIVGYEEEVEFNKSTNNYIDKYQLILQHGLNQKWIDALNKNGQTFNKPSNKLKHNDLSEEQLSQITKDFFKKTDKYSIVKEKTIIKTIDFENDITQAMKDITKHADLNKELKSIINERFDFYLGIMNKLETYNLRSYVFFLIMINRIYLILDPEFQTHKMYNKLLKIIMDSIFYISYDYKSGNKISTVMFKDEEGISSIRHEMGYIKSFDIVNQYVEKNILDKNTFIEYFKNYADKLKMEEVNQIDKLSQFHLMKDSEVVDIIKSIRSKIKDNKLSYKVFPTILNHFGTLESMGFKEVYLDATYKDMRLSIKDQIDDLENQDYRDSFISPINDNTRAFLENYYKYLSNKISERTEKEISITIKDDNWARQLSEEITSKERTFYNYREFFSFLDVDSIIENLTKSYSEEIIIFRSSVRRVYNFSNLEDIFKKDLSSVKDFLEKLKEIKAIDKIAQFNLNLLIKDFEEYKVKLERKSKNA
jgi:hypothetical protein